MESDVMNTVQTLPRTPNEAGLIAVNFKRRLKYKQSYKRKYVSIPKVLRSLETLKNLGNKHYQFVSSIDGFKDRCKEHEINDHKISFSDDDDASESDCLSKPDLTESEDEEDQEEEEYWRKDSVKKWQFEYNNETCFNHEYPEISYKDNVTDCVNVAPGEGKIPTNILEETDWDVKSFPCLLPDGKNSLHSERKVKIKEQYYFNQRILNIDSRFAQNAAYGAHLYANCKG